MKNKDMLFDENLLDLTPGNMADNNHGLLKRIL